MPASEGDQQARHFQGVMGVRDRKSKQAELTSDYHTCVQQGYSAGKHTANQPCHPSCQPHGGPVSSHVIVALDNRTLLLVDQDII